MASARVSAGAGTLCGTGGPDGTFDGARNGGGGGNLACGRRGLRHRSVCGRRAQCQKGELAADERSAGGGRRIGAVHGGGGTDLGRGNRNGRRHSAGLLRCGRTACRSYRKAAGPQGAGESAAAQIVSFNKNSGGGWGISLRRRCMLFFGKKNVAPNKYVLSAAFGYRIWRLLDKKGRRFPLVY